jgi:prophage regulatory protein
VPYRVRLVPVPVLAVARDHISMKNIAHDAMKAGTGPEPVHEIGQQSPAGAPLRLAHVALLDVKELAANLGICARSCWRLSALAESGHGRFPRPVRIGPKTIRWRLADVEAYLAGLAERGGE